MEHKGLPVIAFESVAAMEAWLSEPAEQGFWLRFAKKSSGIPSVTYAEAVEVALCFGWIDGLANPLDEQFWLQRFTPRRPRSIWSQINRDKVAKLIEQGRMRPSGLAQVDKAKADGRWAAAYAGPKTMPVPDDLLAAPDETARKAWDALDKTNRYAVLHRIHAAKRPETRAKRIAEFAVMLAEGRVLYPKKQA